MFSFSLFTDNSCSSKLIDITSMSKLVLINNLPAQNTPIYSIPCDDNGNIASTCRKLFDFAHDTNPPQAPTGPIISPSQLNGLNGLSDSIAIDLTDIELPSDAYGFRLYGPSGGFILSFNEDDIGGVSFSDLNLSSSLPRGESFSLDWVYFDRAGNISGGVIQMVSWESRAS